jgi:hypothetical protein
MRDWYMVQFSHPCRRICRLPAWWSCHPRVIVSQSLSPRDDTAVTLFTVGVSSNSQFSKKRHNLAKIALHSNLISQVTRKRESEQTYMKITVFWDLPDVKSGRKLPKIQRNLLRPSSGLKSASSKTMAIFYQNIWRRIPQDSSVNIFSLDKQTEIFPHSFILCIFCKSRLKRHVSF